MAYPQPRQLGASALVLAAATCAGCTIYATDHDSDWDDDWDRRPTARLRSDSGTFRTTSAVPGSPGGGDIAAGLVGRPVRMGLVEADAVGAQALDGTIREMGDWIRLERDNGSSVYIPRERIRYIELREAATTQP